MKTKTKKSVAQLAYEAARKHVIEASARRNSPREWDELEPYWQEGVVIIVNYAVKHKGPK